LDWDVYGRWSARLCGDNVQICRIQFGDMKREMRFAEVRHEKAVDS
jgi:hypothetical protein